VDPAVVSTDGRLPVGSPGIRIGMGTFYHWRVGGEIVAVKDKIASDDLNRIKAAMMKASPSESLALTETMLPKIMVLGGTVRVAIAEELAPPGARSVVLGEEQIRAIRVLLKRG